MHADSDDINVCFCIWPRSNNFLVALTEQPRKMSFLHLGWSTAFLSRHCDGPQHVIHFFLAPDFSVVAWKNFGKVSNCLFWKMLPKNQTRASAFSKMFSAQEIPADGKDFRCFVHEQKLCLIRLIRTEWQLFMSVRFSCGLLVFNPLPSGALNLLQI